jgi:hypothetical protein
LLLLRASQRGQEIEVNIGGNAVFMARGAFELEL